MVQVQPQLPLVSHANCTTLSFPEMRALSQNPQAQSSFTCIDHLPSLSPVRAFPTSSEQVTQDELSPSASVQRAVLALREGPSVSPSRL